MFLPHPSDRRTALWGSIAGAPIGFFGGLLIAALMAHGSQPQDAALNEGSLQSAPPTNVPQIRQSSSHPTLALNLATGSQSTSRVTVPTTTSSPVITPVTPPSPVQDIGEQHKNEHKNDLKETKSNSTTTSPQPSPPLSTPDETPTMELPIPPSVSLEKQER